MITLEDIWTKDGYSSYDHLLPDAQDVFADLIGQRFASLRDIKRAIAKNDERYEVYRGRYEYARNMMMGAKIRHASGALVTVDL